jgi:predicted RNase H-related nuclease YkuK (DUF458 family)
MEKYFRTEQGERVNIVEHTLEQLKLWPHLKVYIGTDSQDYGKVTRYATAIVYRYGKRGAHYIFHVDEVPKHKDMFTRLYDEGVRTIETAQVIDNEIPIAFEALEFDYNHIPKFNSNKLLASIRGWVTGLNYRGVFKNSDKDMMIAAKAADHLCRHKKP